MTTTLSADRSDTLSTRETSPDATPWWKGATIYHVYPRSFRDTNGDGIGDLPGVIEGLDHIASLGVDAVWISPFFTSPMKDFGYDVADYCDVDPSFGTLADFDRLIESAHALGLKVLIDQVYSHTSDAHAWFQDSRTGRDSAKSDWYVWADAKPDGSPPTNWQSVFAGAAWQWDARRKQYYLHNFLPSQPDLNVRHPDVQAALLDVARFWLDRGVDGFRLDAINFAMHDPALADNPPSGLSLEDITRPFDMQEHRFNQSHPDILPFLEDLRRLLDSFGAKFTVAEIGGPTPLDEMRAFTEGERRLNSAYSFDFLYAPDLSADVVKRALANWDETPGQGWPSWAFSNHDAPRALSRWSGGGNTEDHARLYLMLLLSLRGNVFLYQGEELGLPQGEVAFEDLQDPEAIENWPHTLGRDGARTPFPWTAQAPNAGFSDGAPWLPMDSRQADRALDRQDLDSDSMLAFSRKVIALRQRTAPLRLGTLDFIAAPSNLIAFTRRYEGQTILCVNNCTNTDLAWSPSQPGKILASSAEFLKAGAPCPATVRAQSGYWALLGDSQIAGRTG